jgi:hypothetical protein
MPWRGVLQCDACRVGTVAREGEQRIGCIVPGCRRSTKVGDFDEWVCGRHWPTVPRQMRRLYAAAKRRARRSVGMPETMRSALVAARVWRRCRDAAIEIAMGIR